MTDTTIERPSADTGVASPFVRPDVRGFLDYLNSVPGPKMHEQSPADARAVYHAMKDVADPPVGELAVIRDLSIPGPDGVTIPARLFDTRESRAPGPVVVFYHGGGFVIGDIDTHASFTAEMARQLDLPVVSVDYRLAPEAPFPAAVEDAVAAVRFVLDQGTDPARLALGGDSAGGGLTLATLVALRDEGLPLPGAAVAISPWVDMTASSDSIHSKGDEDPMLTPATIAVLADAYLAGADPKSPTASPLWADLSGLPPLLIQVGTAEVLLDEGRRVAEAATAAGVDVTFEAWDDMIHVWHLFADMVPESREAIEKIGAFLDERLA